MTKPDPKYDNVVVLTERELQRIERGNIVEKEVQGVTYTFHMFNKYSPSCPYKSPAPKVTNRATEMLRAGEAAGWAYENTDCPPISVIHEDYAGTPKSKEAAAERLFQLFKDHDGEARQVAQEALHLLGYEIQKDVEYSLVEK